MYSRRTCKHRPAGNESGQVSPRRGRGVSVRGCLRELWGSVLAIGLAAFFVMLAAVVVAVVVITVAVVLAVVVFVVVVVLIAVAVVVVVIMQPCRGRHRRCSGRGLRHANHENDALLIATRLRRCRRRRYDGGRADSSRSSGFVSSISSCVCR